MPAATVSVKGESRPDWTFHLHELGNGHWVSVARAPPCAVVDAWGVRLPCLPACMACLGLPRLLPLLCCLS